MRRDGSFISRSEAGGGSFLNPGKSFDVPKIDDAAYCRRRRPVELQSQNSVFYEEDLSQTAIEESTVPETLKFDVFEYKPSTIELGKRTGLESIAKDLEKSKQVVKGLLKNK